MGRWNSNQRGGGAASVLFMARLFSFMWTPSKAWILSQGTVHSLSPNNLLQNTSVSFLTGLLFLWTAKAKSRGEPALPLKMTTVPLHFLPHHCVLYGLYKGELLCSIWPRLVQYLNMMMAGTWLEFQQQSLLSRLQRSQTAHTGDGVNPWIENKDITFIQMLLIFLAGFTHFILHCAMKFHRNDQAQNKFPYRTTI